jgi:hypothetical protein
MYTLEVVKVELGRCHMQEKVEKDLAQVQELESILVIMEQWTPTSPKWVETVTAIKQWKYQLTPDALELLIVKHIFKLKPDKDE